MKKIAIYLFVFAQIVVLFFGSSVQQVYARSGAAEAAGKKFTFKELGYDESIMSGPYDAKRIFFSLPPSWKLATGGTLTLRYYFSVSGTNLKNTQGGGPWGGTLTVYFNSRIVDTIVLDQSGEVSKVIQIPAQALESITGDGRHFIALILDASVNCIFEDRNTTLLVGSDSELALKYWTVSPPTDLSLFPRPFYQQEALIKEPTTIVIPDAPAPPVLEAAMALSAGLGSISNGEMLLSLVTNSKLFEETRSTNNLIFVGLPTDFPILKGIPLPVPITKGGLVVKGGQPEDGIIQLALSPWNSASVLMLISGNTEQSVLKAAKAVGSEKIVPIGSRLDVAVVSNVDPQSMIKPVEESLTFADLGYTNVTLGELDVFYTSYVFPVSAEQASSSGAYLDLVTSHSNLLNFDETGVTVFLNGNAVGSLQFDKDAAQVSTTRLTLLPNVLRRGINRLEVVSELTPYYYCFAQELSSNWVTISEKSQIYLPISHQEYNFGKNLDLRNFPDLILSDDKLSEIAIVVPNSDLTAWQQAAQMAFYLGNRGGITFPDLKVVYGDSLSEDVLRKRSLVLIGRASSLPIVNDLHDYLPAPFEAGSDEAIQPSMMVNYRLMPGASVGYLQLLQSPWNSERAIVALMGNTQDGVSLAGKTFMVDDPGATLNGNFAIIYGDQVLTTDTRLGLSKEALAAELPIAVTATVDVVPTLPARSEIFTIEGRENWVMPVFIGLTVLILIIVGIVLSKGFANQARERKQNILNKNE